MDLTPHSARDHEALTRDNVLSTTEVAELLGIPRSTVHQLARRGDLLRNGSDDAGCFCATAWRRRSRRSTNRPPGTPIGTRSGLFAIPGCYSATPSTRVFNAAEPEIALPTGPLEKRTTGVEPATFGLGNRS